jgi:hypothetical protein
LFNRIKTLINAAHGKEETQSMAALEFITGGPGLHQFHQSEDNAIRHPIDVAIRDQLNIQLRGTLQLHVSRYLHINTDLVMQHYALEETPELAALSLPASANHKADYRSGLMDGAELSLTEPQAAPIRSARIQQSRRMRSNELHYVDHPMLGLVVKVIPVETEADLFPADDQ